MSFQKQECPVLVVMGQSNAYAHGTLLPEAEQIRTPLANVFGLSRTLNQSYDLDSVTWTGFTSGDMVLGEIPDRDHGTSLGNYFARQWQDRIDAGEALPDLYIIQIARGGQGVDEMDIYDGYTMNMWWPDRPKVMTPMDDGGYDLSLYPLAMHVLPLAMESIRAMGKTPVFLGVHWNQWESEVCGGKETNARAHQNLTRVWTGLMGALGCSGPLFLYEPLAEAYNDPEGVAKMRAWIDHCGQDPHVQILDPRKTDFWNPDTRDHGIFQPDAVHYLPKTHRWFAQQQWDNLAARGLIKYIGINYRFKSTVPVRSDRKYYEVPR